MLTVGDADSQFHSFYFEAESGVWGLGLGTKDAGLWEEAADWNGWSLRFFGALNEVCCRIYKEPSGLRCLFGGRLRLLGFCFCELLYNSRWVCPIKIPP